MALSSESTTKALPKEEGKDHIVHFRGECILCSSYSLSIYLICVLCVYVFSVVCCVNLYINFH